MEKDLELIYDPEIHSTLRRLKSLILSFPEIERFDLEEGGSLETGTLYVRTNRCLSLIEKTKIEELIFSIVAALFVPQNYVYETFNPDPDKS